MKMSKTSVSVPLVLLSGVALSGCSGESHGARNPSRGETRYDYVTKEDCLKDWAETMCTNQNSHSGFYHVYRRETVAKNKSQTHAVRVVRGGFGGSSGTKSSVS